MWNKLKAEFMIGLLQELSKLYAPEILNKLYKQSGR